MPCKKSKLWIIEKDWKTFTATRYKDKPFYESTISEGTKLDNLKPWIWGLNKQA
jgi:hypothetical protein